MASLVDKYRATQRRLRRYFDRYTEQLCPDCPEPCCRKPVKVTDFDILLADACGCSLPAHSASAEFLRAGIDMLVGVERSAAPEPCDYLTSERCGFPDDLRPFECARYVCPFLKKTISPGDMREIRKLLHKLAAQHRQLVDAVLPHGG